MAQLVVAGAGAALGASLAPYAGWTFLGISGAGWGWMVGSAIGSSLFSPTTRVQGPRLDDLKVTGLEYGQAIPYVQGHPRVPGQIWWSSAKREIATTTTQGGKGGGPTTETTTYTYEVDLLYGLSDNEIIGVSRIWSNGKLIYTALSDASVASLSASANTDLWTRVTVYTGASTQTPDATYEAAVGTTNATAYRGRASIFIEALQLGSSGQLPQLTFEVVTNGTTPTVDIYSTIAPTSETLLDVVSRLCLRAGLIASQFDVTDLASATKDVRALAVSQVSSTRSVFELLASTYFFDAAVSDKIYFRLRGAASSDTIAYTDLGASLGETAEQEPLAIKRSNELELPAQFALTYSNVSNDYQLDTQMSDRLLTAMESVSTVGVPLGFTPSEAKAVADTMMVDSLRSSITINISVLGKYCRLEPTDVATITDEDGSTYRVRFTKKIDNYPVISFEAVLDHASVLTSAGTTSSDYTSSVSVDATADTSMVLMDIPILRDADDDPGHYVAMRGSSTPWAGAGLYKSPDNVTYSSVAVVTEGAVLGTTTTALGNWSGPRIFDEANTVVVDVGSGNTLSSSTRDSILNSASTNAMLIGSEIIQFVTATMSASGVYTLKRLLRGCRGTEWATMSHSSTENCVLLRTTGLRRVDMGNSELGISRYYKGVTLGRALSTATAQSFSNTGIGIKPFSPFSLRKTIDPLTNNITLDWQRRSRLSVRATGSLGISVPLGETSESYDVEVYTTSAFSTLKRTLTTGSASVVYTSSQQFEDFGGNQTILYAKVYQISATVDQGYALQQIV